MIQRDNPILIALGIPIVWKTLAALALIALLLLCAFTGCASLENHDAYWNKVRAPLTSLAGPGWAITDK